MNFIKALGKLGIENKVYVMKRKLWGSDTPYKYLWVTDVNCLVASVGNEQSCPPLLEVSDFLAEDWEVDRIN